MYDFLFLASIPPIFDPIISGINCPISLCALQLTCRDVYYEYKKHKNSPFMFYYGSYHNIIIGKGLWGDKGPDFIKFTFNFYGRAIRRELNKIKHNLDDFDIIGRRLLTLSVDVSRCMETFWSYNSGPEHLIYLLDAFIANNVYFSELLMDSKIYEKIVDHIAIHGKYRTFELISKLKINVPYRGELMEYFSLYINDPNKTMAAKNIQIHISMRCAGLCMTCKLLVIQHCLLLLYKNYTCIHSDKPEFDKLCKNIIRLFLNEIAIYAYHCNICRGSENKDAINIMQKMRRLSPEFNEICDTLRKGLLVKYSQPYSPSVLLALSEPG